ncbi:hypothetical protein VP01_2691g2 [Puccinia sorghi]|uniref:Uncharacterized protein n=1 Tax=Puccinia sorghi TaxID=27349 RepID=A0A0L6V3S2_9BASI|nr:hypothetical protein VP01_2691g2 [Puccinia sorghi]
MSSLTLDFGNPVWISFRSAVLLLIKKEDRCVEDRLTTPRSTLFFFFSHPRCIIWLPLPHPPAPSKRLQKHTPTHDFLALRHRVDDSLFSSLHIALSSLGISRSTYLFSFFPSLSDITGYMVSDNNEAMHFLSCLTTRFLSSLLAQVSSCRSPLPISFLLLCFLELCPASLIPPVSTGFFWFFSLAETFFHFSPAHPGLFFCDGGSIYPAELAFKHPHSLSPLSLNHAPQPITTRAAIQHMQEEKKTGKCPATRLLMMDENPHKVLLQHLCNSVLLELGWQGLIQKKKMILWACFAVSLIFSSTHITPHWLWLDPEGAHDCIHLSLLYKKPPIWLAQLPFQLGEPCLEENTLFDQGKMQLGSHPFCKLILKRYFLPSAMCNWATRAPEFDLCRNTSAYTLDHPSFIHIAEINILLDCPPIIPESWNIILATGYPLPSPSTISHSALNPPLVTSTSLEAKLLPQVVRPPLWDFTYRSQTPALPPQSRKQARRKDSFIVLESKSSVNSSSPTPSPPRPHRDGHLKPAADNHPHTVLSTWALRHHVNVSQNPDPNWSLRPPPQPAASCQASAPAPTPPPPPPSPPAAPSPAPAPPTPPPPLPPTTPSPIPVPLPTPPPSPSTFLPPITIPSSPTPSIRVYPLCPSPRSFLSVPATPNPPLLESPYQIMIPDNKLKLGLPKLELRTFLEQHKGNLVNILQHSRCIPADNRREIVQEFHRSTAALHSRLCPTMSHVKSWAQLQTKMLLQRTVLFDQTSTYPF